MAAIVVRCDGCGAELTVQTKFGGHARQVAAGEGWLCPPSDHGTPGFSFDYQKPDLCPACRPA